MKKITAVLLLSLLVVCTASALLTACSGLQGPSADASEASDCDSQTAPGDAGGDESGDPEGSADHPDDGFIGDVDQFGSGNETDPTVDTQSEIPEDSGADGSDTAEDIETENQLETPTESETEEFSITLPKDEFR